MTLQEVRDHIAASQKISLLELCAHFGTEPDALMPLLDHWISEGVIGHPDKKPGCKGCAGCLARLAATYEYRA